MFSNKKEISLDAAIEHAESVAGEHPLDQCGADHAQLALWLLELKRLRTIAASQGNELLELREKLVNLRKAFAPPASNNDIHIRVRISQGIDEMRSGVVISDQILNDTRSAYDLESFTEMIRTVINNVATEVAFEFFKIKLKQ